MGTLLIVQSHQEAKAQLFRNWPHLQKSGWEILGVVPENSIHSWPPDITHCEIVGKTSGYCSNDVTDRWVKTWQRVVGSDLYKDYDNFCMVEYDSMFLHAPPPHPGGICTNLTGGHIDGFEATQFFHSPWWSDRESAEIIAQTGMTLMGAGKFEKGSVDFFLGLILDHRPDLVRTESNTWSVNGGNVTDRKDECLKAIENGAWFVHGIRTQEEIDWIVEAAEKYERTLTHA